MTASVKPGYKQTEIGVIPEDWEVKQLGYLVRSVEYGSSAKSEVKGAVPVLRMGNLQNGKIEWSDLVYTDDATEINKYKLNPGDVLFNRTNTIDLVGKTSLYEGEQPAIFAGYLIRVNVLPELLNSRFLNYILNMEFSRKHSAKVLSVAVGQANINGQKLKTYPIPLPPTLGEQEAIAGVLSDADGLIESLERLIEKKRQIKQGTMQQLLTGQKRLPGFTDKWEKKRLGELGKFFSGGTPNTSVPQFYGGEIPWITSSDCNQVRIKSVLGRITQSGVANSATKWIKSGTILMALYGATSGVVAVSEIDATINQAVLAIVLEVDDSEFIFQKLRMIREWIITTYTQGGQPNLSGEIVKSIELTLPDPIEQSAIAAILTDMDSEIETLEAKLEKARQIKQGMMHQLLTGRIRLK